MLKTHQIPSAISGSRKRIALMEGVEKAIGELSALSDRNLFAAAEDFRRNFSSQSTVDCRVLAFALMHEALRRRCGVELYCEQLAAAHALSQGAVAEMQTGEGKTFACAPAAFLFAARGRGVHVVTPNLYLAERDCQLLRPAFELLGVQAGLLPEGAAAEEKRAVYNCDVVYGTAAEFGFDYLRDQLSLRQAGAAPLGKSLLSRLRGASGSGRLTMQRGLAYAIVDEIDHVLLDDAISPLILSSSDNQGAPDAQAHLAAWQVSGLLDDELHIRADASSVDGKLTLAGEERIHAEDVAIPVDCLRRTWKEYVEHALRAQRVMRRDVHYVVRDDEIQIVDAATGRLFVDRTWQDGLHQAIEAKEGLTITGEKTALAQITKQRYFRLYEHLCGMTGTAQGCENEFKKIYGLSVTPIPLRLPSQRRLLPTRFFVSAESKWQAIADSVLQVASTGRPVLVGTRSIADSERLAALLWSRNVAFQLLNGRQDKDEADIVAQAGARGAVTIATNLAGRGTDIKLGDGVAELGGLHVIVADCQDCSRVERQLVGRAARQGDPGSAQSLQSAEDSLIERHGSWLQRSARAYASAGGEVCADFSGQIRRIRAAHERAQYAMRCGLLRRDSSHDSLMLRAGGKA